MKNKTEKIKGVAKENVDLMSLPLMSILPGQISFFVILSIVPLASVLVMLITKLSLNNDVVTSFITHYIPGGVGSVLLSTLESQKLTSFDLFFIIAAFYLASKATHSIIVASTRIYNGEQRNFVRTRIKAILMLLILILLVLVLVGVLTVGSKIVEYICTLNADANIVNTIYTILKWPFVFFMIFFTIKVIYTIAPNVSIPSKSVNKGALLTTVVWVISTFFFSFYVTNLANYTKFYGNLSNLIILMMWIYWLCYIFVYGMTINEYKLNNKKEAIK